jgi:hypothetical protein
MEDQVSYLYKIMVLYILIFIFYNGDRKTKESEMNNINNTFFYKLMCTVLQYNFLLS